MAVARVRGRKGRNDVWRFSPYIEMATPKSVGSLLQDSCCTRALVEAGANSSGSAESYLLALSVARTCQAHQITACCL